jgi:tRNA uridine 5-carboxymethylaminomethyl modification enzyme
MYTGRIKGTGPRYCPSIEDKISRFSDKDHHQIFLEPEGYDSLEYYVNGFSTSLPEDVQERALRTIPGLENVMVLRPGYAVEYDFFPPYQINLNMESKLIRGLFLAGQINGTSGYEEAGAQGMMAGINAALSVKTGGSFVLRRNEAYIGVLIDDLVNKSTLEPYRIFTSLAEYRLLLRYDNADLRLTEKGRSLGLVSDEQFALLMRKVESIRTVRQWLTKHHVRPAEINDFLRQHGSSDIAEPEVWEKLIKRPEVTLEHMRLDLPDLLDEGIIECLDFSDVRREVNTTIKYEGYIQRQLEQVARFERLEAKRIPPAFPYGQIKSLSKEAREKLTRVRPESVGQASRISGITPADISLLLVYLEKGAAVYNQEAV